MNRNQKVIWAGAATVAALALALSAAHAGAEPRRIYDNPLERNVGLGANHRSVLLDDLFRLPIRLHVAGGVIQVPRLPVGDEFWGPAGGRAFND